MIVKPNVNCSTRYIYSKVKSYSEPIYSYNNGSFFKSDVLVKSRNDLEKVVFKKYSNVKKLKQFLEKLPNVIFARMTGSGSAVVAYFKSKNAANRASKIFKKKYKNYWYNISKTI